MMVRMMEQLTAENIANILAFAPQFERPYEAWKFDEWGTSMQFYQFVGALTNNGFIYPFDWNTWLIAEGHGRVFSHTILLDADLPLLRKVMTATVRADRYQSGLHARLVRNGFFRVFLEQLGALSL